MQRIATLPSPNSFSRDSLPELSRSLLARFEVMAVMNVKMLIVQGHPAGKCLLFPGGEFYFGRGQECHVRINSEWVSRQHCVLRITDTAVSIRDLASRNGTLVNGTLVEGERRLHPGDLVQIGPTFFEMQFEVVAAPAPETVNKLAEPTAEIAKKQAEPTAEIKTYQGTSKPAEIETDVSVELAQAETAPK
jgi:predicted component of type VI protein secretion system